MLAGLQEPELQQKELMMPTLPLSIKDVQHQIW